MKKRTIIFGVLLFMGLFLGMRGSPVRAASYSLSFPKEPMTAFWPTPPNSVQQVEAFLWGESSLPPIKDAQNLTASWKLPGFITAQNTGTYYFDKCPQVRKDLPCLMFYAQITTQASGRSSLTLEVRQGTNMIAWNSVPFEVTVSPTPIATTASPAPKHRVFWRTENVSLTADDFYILVNGKKYYGIPDSNTVFSVHSDPGSSTYTSLELSWREQGVPMRLFFYFHSDGSSWWSDEMRTFNGLTAGDWVMYIIPKLISGNVGFPVTKDLITFISTDRYGGNVHFENLALQAFLGNPPSPSCRPRPACLDTNPRCQIPEPVEGWCKPSPTPSPRVSPPPQNRELESVQQRISYLEERLAQTENRVSVLQSIVNSIADFIKRLFRMSPTTQ